MSDTNTPKRVLSDEQGHAFWNQARAAALADPSGSPTRIRFLRAIEAAVLASEGATAKHGADPEEAKRGFTMVGSTKQYCCYGMYADVGHDSTCKHALSASSAPAAVQQGCELCSSPLFAGTQCKNCGRVAAVQEGATARMKAAPPLFTPEELEAAAKVPTPDHLFQGEDVEHPNIDGVQEGATAAPDSLLRQALEVLGGLHETAAEFNVSGVYFDEYESNRKVLARSGAAIASLRSALSRPAGKVEAAWQPIETGPKHEPVLLFSEGFIHEDFNPAGIVEGAWLEDRGWVGAVWNGEQDCYDTNEIVPTDWMPLPAPPAVNEGAA
jgi:hypothetical protein